MFPLNYMAKFSLIPCWILNALSSRYSLLKIRVCHRHTFKKKKKKTNSCSTPYFLFIHLFLLWGKTALLSLYQAALLAGGSHPGWALLGLSPGAAALLLHQSQQMEQQPWLAPLSLSLRGAAPMANFQQGLGAKDDIRSHLTSWSPAQRPGSSSCTSAVPKRLCSPCPPWLNSQQDKGIKPPTNTLWCDPCFSPAPHTAAPREVHTSEPKNVVRFEIQLTLDPTEQTHSLFSTFKQQNPFFCISYI